MDMNAQENGTSALKISSSGGLAGLALKALLMRLRRVRSPQPRLELLERITLAPRQSLALIEADGRRFLVATSPEGGPAFLSLDSNQGTVLRRSPRVSW